MSQMPISPLRARMIQDTTVRNFAEKTKNDYIRCVKSFAAFLGRSPDQATAEDLRAFQVHQTETGVRPPTINGSVAALRFFFATTLGGADMSRHLAFVRDPRKIPVILNTDEVARLIEAAPGPKYKATFAAQRKMPSAPIASAGGMNDMGLDTARSQPAGQPEAVPAGLRSTGAPRPTGLTPNSSSAPFSAGCAASGPLQDVRDPDLRTSAASFFNGWRCRCAAAA